MVGLYKLSAIGGGFSYVLDLRCNRRYPSLAQYRLFRRNRLHSDSAVSTVVADPSVIYDGRVIDNSAVIYVVDNRGIHVCHCPVIGEPAVLPISAVVASPNISVTVVDPPIEADVPSPVSMIQTVAAAIKTPVWRSP